MFVGVLSSPKIIVSFEKLAFILVNLVSNCSTVLIICDVSEPARKFIPSSIVSTHSVLSLRVIQGVLRRAHSC